MNALRNVTALSLAAAAGAVLGLAQVAAAELTDITTLGADFGGGDDRVQGVQITLVAWYCAMAVPLAVILAGARRGLGRTARWATVLAAAAGTLATWPLVASVSGDGLHDEAVRAVITGTLFGAVGAAIVVLVPVVGRGLAAYAGLLWAAALAFTGFVSNTVVYAGMVEPLDLDFLDSWRGSVPDLPDELGYHVTTMLPVAVVILLFAGVVGGFAARRTGSWPRSVAAAVAGPVLTAILYRLPPRELFLWNESAALATLLLAGGCLLIAAVTALVFRRRTPDSAPGEEQSE
ncbi:hypothetical protein [Actinomadura sp. DC4]|uniref:hypothetical protein n=1 Tax=Actinomadura sp. DC4 TaxID=3055069 RepID=UPI0025B19398|nr:hypothetical protein [Actinomadura sp. DC4]MDN3355643.1 hypothetical protein [Actinomadura sp. DC4]